MPTKRLTLSSGDFADLISPIRKYGVEPDDCIITVIIVKRRDETGLCVPSKAASEDEYFEKASGQCWECQVNHSYSSARKTLGYKTPETSGL